MRWNLTRSFLSECKRKWACKDWKVWVGRFRRLRESLKNSSYQVVEEKKAIWDGYHVWLARPLSMWWNASLRVSTKNLKKKILFEILDIWNFGHSKTWTFEILDISNLGLLKFWTFQTLDIWMHRFCFRLCISFWNLKLSYFKLLYETWLKLTYYLLVLNLRLK